MNKKNRVGLLVAVFCIFTSALSAMQRVRMVGISSDFSTSAVNHKPAVRIVKMGGMDVSDEINPPVHGGALQSLNAAFPVEITIKYPKKDYVVVVDRVGNADKLPCFGANPLTVGARIKSTSGSYPQYPKVCLSLSETAAANSVVKSGDFNGVVLFLRPEPKYDPLDPSSLPFTFGLSAWTSDQAPWTGQTLSSTNQIGGGDTRNYRFSQNPLDQNQGKPLTIYQGFGGLGGGQIPRMHHASIGHIFNDTNDIVLISRQSTNPALSKFNFSQMIPPKAAFPYIMFWIPKLASKDDLAIGRHDGIRISLLHKKPKIQNPDYVFYTDIGEDLGTDYAVDIPQGFEELQALIEQNMRQTDEGVSDILGTSQWRNDEGGDYPGLSIANHYYMIATDAQEKKTYVQKCSLETDECELTAQAPVEKAGETSYTPSGLPSYYNLIINKDNKGEFGVELYKTTLRPPFRS